MRPRPRATSSAKGLSSANATLALTLKSMGEVQRAQLDGLSRSLKELSESNQTSLERIRTTFDARVRELQDGNEKKLEEMRKTVDEKLHITLEKRLGESFKLVSDQLESVQKGLGEMQNLATGVGDLKRVLTNVKARGTWAEVQLGALLEEILTPGQFEKNVHVEAGLARAGRVRRPAARAPRTSPTPASGCPSTPSCRRRTTCASRTPPTRGDCEATQRATDALARAIRLARARTSTASTSSRRTPPTSRSCSWPPRASTPRSCASRRSSTTCSTATASSSPAPPRWRRCSAACAWASRRWPSSSRPSRSGGCSAR